MKLKGWKNIFYFTFIQQVKTKSFIVSTVIIGIVIALMAASANIIPSLLLQNEIDKAQSAAAGNEQKLSVTKLYIADESGLSEDYSDIGGAFGFAVESIAPQQADAKIAELEGTSQNEMLAHITKAEGRLAVEAYYAGTNSDIGKSDCEMVANALAQEVKARFLVSLGVAEDELAAAMGNVAVMTSQAGKAPTSMVQDMVNTFVPMIGSLVLFIFIFAYSQLIAQAIAIEKSSRVMEFLLTSVNPLSIIVGKVLAICLVSLMQFIILCAAGVIGFLASMPFGIFSKMGSVTEMIVGEGIDVKGILSDITGAFSTVNAGTLLIIIITFVLGFLLYALIAGLAGASISKMEDLSAAIQPMSIIGVLGFYIAYIPQVTAIEGDTNALMVIARFLPISSPFCLPSAYMLGQMNLPEVLLALLALLVCVIAMFVIVAKVYEHIVLHTGDRLKLGDMLKMSKKTQ